MGIQGFDTVAMLSIAEQVRINATPARIWRALTSPDELVEWYAPGCRWEISSLAPGAEVRFYNTDSDVQTATIEAVEEPRFLALRWQIDPRDPSVTILNRFELQAGGSATEVIVSQSGYEALPLNVQRQSFDQDRAAVAAIAGSLKVHVEKAQR